MTTASCSAMREAVSALADGENPGMDREVLDAHTARCDDCRRFTAGATELARRVRVRRAEPVPDLTGRILAELPDGPAPPPPRRTLSPRVLVGVAAAVVVIVGAAFAGGRLLGGGSGSGPVRVTQVAGSDQASSRYPGATVLPRTYPKPDLTLTDTAGRPYNVALQTAGVTTLVYFGYTNCPDECPITMALAAQAVQRLSPAQRGRVRVVFITTDPQRDTPTVIRSWLDHFNPAFIGLDGTQSQIQAAERSVGMPLSYDEGPPPGSVNPRGGAYQVVHAGYTLVYSDDGVAHLQVDDTVKPKGFATTLQHLVADGYQPA